MSRFSYLGLFAVCASLASACSDPVLPPTPATDVPDADVLDSAVVDRPDTSILDRPDVGPIDVTDVVDVPRDIQRDTTPLDVPPGTTWCDLPMGPDAEVRGVTLPAGFCIRRYGRLTHPRVMQFSPSGDLFIASWGNIGPGGTGPGIGAIVVAPDDNRDGVADNLGVNAVPDANRDQVADDLGIYANDSNLALNWNEMRGDASVVERDSWSSMHGILFHRGFLYLTTQNHVFRVPFTAGDRVVPRGATVERVADLEGAVRPTHTLAAGADGALYVSMGNYGLFMCPNTQPRQGAILRIRSAPGDTTIPLQGQIVAQGFRNPMYMRCQTWGCYAAELTDDGWTAPGREKLIRFGDGQDYGYPCCYDVGLPAPTNGGRVSCAGVTPSLAGFPIGYTPFGHDFEKGIWPAPYANGVFIGLHGQVGSWNNTGINWAPVNPTTHAFLGDAASVFMGGWGRGTPNEGRVADLVFAPDGRLFFTDDQLGHIYWIAPRTLQIPAR
jgi:glucose/arabinose dehydrogenase